jgi:signal transduction histidine kinase/CheY-like chemotaxis protein
LVLLPLVTRGRSVGVLSLGLRPAGRTFDPERLALASDLAGRAAIALDNAFLYKAMRDQDRRKTEFLAMLAHELRNPLAPITNAVHVLRTEASDPGKQAWAREILERQVSQLRRLVDDLLDVSRITHGKIDLKTDTVDIAEVVAVAVETARPFISAGDHALTVRLPSSPVRVKGDFARLAQILANLLNNAAKYTERGGQIGIDATAEGEQAVIRVRDSGIGIPAESQAAIFELFRQLGPAPDRVQGGLGVGLTLVKRLVEMHGGTIEARSEGRGKGSEFTVRLALLPDRAAEAAVEDRPVEREAAATRKRHRILVADDNVDLATSMGVLLEMMGNEVRVVHDGTTAVAMEEVFRPDVIFLDVGMATMSGHDACRRIRGKPWGREPTIVALTGWGHAEDKRRSREAGFDHHLVKPMEPAALERFLAALGRQAA